MNIPAPNCERDARNLRLIRSELPAAWSDISNAVRGLKDRLLHMLVLDEVLGFELSNLSKQPKLKPGVDENHRVLVVISNDLWFRGMEIKKQKRGRTQKNRKLNWKLRFCERSQRRINGCT